MNRSLHNKLDWTSWAKSSVRKSHSRPPCVTQGSTATRGAGVALAIALFLFCSIGSGHAGRFIWTGDGASNQTSLEGNWEGGVGPTGLQGVDLVFGPIDDASHASVAIDVPGNPNTVTFEEGAPALAFVTRPGDFPQLLALLGGATPTSLINNSGQPQTFKVQMHQLWVGGPPIRRWEAARGELVFDLPVFARGDSTKDTSYTWEWVAENPIDFRGGVTAVGDWGLGSSLVVEKSGPESVTLNRDSTWNGALSILEGPLVVNGSISITDDLSVLAGGTLAGNGKVSAHVSVDGTLSPGWNGAGRLAFERGLTLSGTLEVDIGGSPEGSDLVSVSGGRLALGGALVVRGNRSDFSAGKVFKVLEFPEGEAKGDFSSVELPPLPDGLTWQNNLAQDGTLMVKQ